MLSAVVEMLFGTSLRQGTKILVPIPVISAKLKTGLSPCLLSYKKSTVARTSALCIYPKRVRRGGTWLGSATQSQGAGLGEYGPSSVADTVAGSPRHSKADGERTRCLAVNHSTGPRLKRIQRDIQ